MSFGLVSQSRPISCIQVTEKFIFVCEGPGLLIFSRSRKEKIVEKTIFPQHKTILGISLWTNSNSKVRIYYIFAFGRNFAQLYYFYEPTNEIQPIILSTAKQKDDYCSGVFDNEIHTYIAAKWLEDGQKLAAVTDENILHIWDWGQELECVIGNNGCHPAITFAAVRGIQTSLFSATLTGDREEDLIVFSGTNLSSVFVWAPQDQTLSYHILLEGIKGSVLSLKFWEQTQVLVASSDERSVFAWKFSSSASSSSSQNVFGPQALLAKSVQVYLISEMIGHTGRVWDVDINDNYIVSAGQDSNIILWSLKGKLLKVWSGSNSINIRCCTIDSWGKSVLSGGDDGSVSKWRISDSANWEKNIAFIDTPNGLKDDHPRKVICYNTDHFICPMKSGVFLLVDTEGHQSEIFYEKDLYDYSSSSLSLNKEDFICGSKLGLVVFLQLTQTVTPEMVADKDQGKKLKLIGDCYQKMQLDSKIISIWWVGTNKIVVSTCTAFYVLAREDRNSSSNGDSSESEWTQVRQFTINWKDKPGLTVATELEISSKCNDDNKPLSFLIVGDEWSSLHVFSLNQEPSSPLFTLPKVHGIYGVLDLKRGVGEGELWTIGRNKSILNLRLELEDTLKPRLAIVQDVNTCLNWNSKFISSRNETYVCGFAENDFVIVDRTNDKIAKKFPCGGAHRSWDFDFKDGIVTFAFLRFKNLSISRFSLDSETIKGGFYGGKTVNVITTFYLEPKKLCILTGGEDATLRLTVTEPNKNDPSELTTYKVATLKEHASSIRVIKYVQLQVPAHQQQQDYRFLIFSGGGRSEIIASLLEFRGGNTVWRKRSLLVLHTGTSEAPKYGYDNSSNPDMRVMDIHIARTREDYSENGDKFTEYLLLCACSDGSMKLISYHSSRHRFSLLCNFNSKVSISNVSHSLSQVCSTRNGDRTFCTNSIGEAIVFLDNLLNQKYTFNYNYSPVHNLNHHTADSIPFVPSSCSVYRKRTNESAITAMKVISINYSGNNNNYDLIITGSDDGILKVSVAFEKTSRNNGSSNKTLVIVPLYEDRKLHSAAINSICILKNFIFVASADQVISYRKLMDWKNPKSFRCGVSDVQAMSICVDPLLVNSCYVLLGGHGFEIRRVKFS